MLEIIEDGDVMTVRALDHETFVLRHAGFLLGALIAVGMAIFLKMQGIWTLSFILPVVAIFLLPRAFATTTEIKINRDMKSVTVRRRGLFTYNFKVYSFNDFAAEPSVSQITQSASLKYELSFYTQTGEKVELCDRQSDTDQLDVVAKWLCDALPKLPPAPTGNGVLKLKP